MPKGKIKEKKCMLAGVWTKGMPAPRSDPSCLPPEDWEASEKLTDTEDFGMVMKESFTLEPGRCITLPNYSRKQCQKKI